MWASILHARETIEPDDADSNDGGSSARPEPSVQINRLESL